MLRYKDQFGDHTLEVLGAHENNDYSFREATQNKGLVVVDGLLELDNFVTSLGPPSGFEEGKFLFYAFLPHKGKERSSALSEAMSNGYNTVLYEAPHRLDKLLNEILILDEDRELFLAKEISKKYQSYYRGTAKSLNEQFKELNIRGEWVVIIKAQKSAEKSLSFTEVLSLDLPPKPKAKLLAHLSDKSVKECFQMASDIIHGL